MGEAIRTVGNFIRGGGKYPSFCRQKVLRFLTAIVFAALISGLSACSRERGEEAFVGDRNVTLWNSLAQVRQPVTVVHYGERVEIMERQSEQAHVRTASGSLGWTDQRYLMDSALWHRVRDLTEKARSQPVQGHASTDKLTNVHIDPGRATPRTYQLRSGTPLEVLGRAVAEVTRGGTEDAAPETKREDWALVRSQEDPAGEIVGWVLRRFVKYEIPRELVDYSTQYRFVAWFELNRVAAAGAALADGAAARPGAREAPGPPESVRAAQASQPREKPQFLVAGILGPDGQACDFTLIRVYTWGAGRRRYETAYMESNLCGSLPIVVHPAGAQGPYAGFAFTNRGRRGEEHREYVMQQTSVHRTDNRLPGAGAHPSRGVR